MPSNYTGNPATALAPVVIAEPIDGDADNGTAFQTPYTTIADLLAAAVDRLEGLMLGPATMRTVTTAFVAGMTGVAFGSGLGVGGGRFALVGSVNGTTPLCQTSDDFGNSYTSRASFATAFGTNLPNAIAWNGTIFVAVGSGGAIATSADGITWNARTSGVATALNSVAWSPAQSLWIAGGASTVVLTSPDGTTWTSRATGQTAGTVYVTWGAGPALFVAVTTLTGTTANSIATSPNGTTWTLRTAPVSNMFFVGYAPYPTTPIYVLWSSTSGTLWTSPDGINWTNRYTTPASYTYSIPPIFTGRSAAMPAASNSAPLITSKDGVTWGTRPPPVPILQPAIGAVVVNNTIWYAYGIPAGNGGLANGPSQQLA